MKIRAPGFLSFSVLQTFGLLQAQLPHLLSVPKHTCEDHKVDVVNNT